MQFLPALVNKWVLVAALPYIAIAAYDFRIHETDRRVPTAERACHAVTITAILLFLLLAALGMNIAAAVTLVVMLIAAAIDEFQFHAYLEAYERNVHFMGGVAWMFCIGVWLWTI